MSQPDLEAAILKAVEEKRTDPEYQARLQHHLEENRRVLERLADE